MEFRIMQAGSVSYGTLDKGQTPCFDELSTEEHPPVKNVNFVSNQFWCDF